MTEEKASFREAVWLFECLSDEDQEEVLDMMRCLAESHIDEWSPIRRWLWRLFHPR